MRASFPLTVQGGRIRAALAAFCAMAALAVVAVVAPSSAHAAFTLERCQGSEVTGEGSSLQKLAQKDWQSKIFDNPSEEGCENPPVVNYKTASSGCGLDAVGAGTEASGCEFTTSEKEKWEKPGYRDGLVRFSAADFAPTPEQEKNIDDGPSGAGQPGSGEIHVIPVAGAAITVIVHFPQGCVLKTPGIGTPASGANTLNEDVSTGGVNDSTNDPTGDQYSNQTVRVHIKDETLEKIWQGQVTTWGGIVKGQFIKVAEGAGKEPSVCEAEPIIRIVREDASGTTYNFKHFLALLPYTTGGGPALWTSASSLVGTKNTAWPLESGPGVPADVNGTTNVCESTEHICHAAAGKGSSLALAVKDNSGSIGYLDLATAREEGFNMTPNPSGEPGDGHFNEAENDRLYWVPLETVEPPALEASEVGKVDSGVFVEPTAITKAHFSGEPEAENGANCEGAAWRNIPSKASSPNEDPTLGDWSKAIATGGTKKTIEKTPTTAYPVCAITYDLAFDDDAAVFGNTPSEEARARTVKDYLTSVVSPSGQLTKLTLFDYATLPLEIIHDAEKGVEVIGWNKSAGNTTNNNNGNNNNGNTNTGGGSSTPSVAPAVVTPPSNAFSIAGAKVKGKDVVLSLVLPGAGKVQIKATGGGVTVANVTASVGGGQGTVTLPISGAAVKKLAKIKGHKLSVKITVTFTPTGGTAASKTKTITITQAAIAPKKKKGKKKG
jgi:hypothetical protein